MRVKQVSLSSRRSRASCAVLVLMCVLTAASPLAAQEKMADPASATAAAPASSADVITLPDGKRVELKLASDVSTATAKVGDDVELNVAFAVLQDGLVIIPKGTVFSAKITSVRHAGHALKYGSVTFSVENAVLPGGATAALLPEPPPTAGQKFRENAKTVGYLAEAPGLPPGAGLVLLAVAPAALFWKGHEMTYYAGRPVTLFVHGPVSLKQEAVLEMQPPP